MKNYTNEIAHQESQKAIQGLLDEINFPTTTEASKTLGCLIMQATKALDALMGPEYAVATILQVMEMMSTGSPQASTKVEIINRAKRH